ncbi:alpha/beta hydrolase domain-containing protein [Tessaracoccus antarcticus]|uniref:alpha/beta hydrolase domain-containing protein n=1 Tax=Tessaracoccus antarcticus TaxID=2479848 RepID=UPI001F37198C|nr:alpha/beta hydrolase domain-containing protein [Tessaracoccus antarcticus]
MLGGLRSPYLDVPTSTWSGTSTGASLCFIAGHEVPFSKATLTSLYSSHNDYVKKVKKNTESLVNQRFITALDGQALIKEAKQSDIP